MPISDVVVRNLVYKVAGNEQERWWEQSKSHHRDSHDTKHLIASLSRHVASVNPCCFAYFFLFCILLLEPGFSSRNWFSTEPLKDGSFQKSLKLT